MSRKFPKPFFRTGRGWYVQLGKEQIKLADGPENAETQDAALTRYYEIMTERGNQALSTPAPSGISVVEVLDKYLAWCKTHRAPRTYEWYHDHIQGFINHAGDKVKLPATALKPFHVVEWADSHGDSWSNAYRRGAIIALQRPFNWAEELGYIEHSPIKRIPKPQPQRREQFVSPEEWEKIKNHYDDGDPFRDLLEFSWLTGCRPQESKVIEARHVDLAAHRVVFPPEEAKGKKRRRIIRMTPEAEAIIKRHLDQHPESITFRNEDGEPWTRQAMACRFQRLKKHLGIQYCATSIRQGFCQDLLEQGFGETAVAEIMGHANSRMVSTTYSHMNKADSHLDRVLQRREKTRQQTPDGTSPAA